MVHVDTAPGKPPLDASFEGVEKPLVWEDIEAEENLDGLSDEQKATFRARALPVPGEVVRGTYTFTNDARRDIPSTLIATGFSAADYQQYAKDHPDWAFLAGIPELRTRPGSTCRRATGRCGRSRTTSRGSSARCRRSAGATTGVAR